jgi:hypothetical protein
MSSFSAEDAQKPTGSFPEGSKLASFASRLVAKAEEAENVEGVVGDGGIDSGEGEEDDSDNSEFDAYDSYYDDDEEGEVEDPTKSLVERLVNARSTSDAPTAAKITELLQSLGLNFQDTAREKRTDVFGEANTPPTFEHLAERMKAGAYKKIVVLTGAGVSVAAGIPDFRTPGTGLYDNLEKYNLPHPTAVFDIGFYKRNPSPFVMLASEIWPGRHLPTLTHAFLKVLDDKGLLLRNYTQNIDGLEVIAGVKEEVRSFETRGEVELTTDDFAPLTSSPPSKPLPFLSAECY